MRKYVRVAIELLIVYILLLIYAPLCAFLFSTIPMSKPMKIFLVPVIEEGLRLLSICMGGLIQYVFTFAFAIVEYIHIIALVNIKTGGIPTGLYFYRFLCIFVHLGLLFIQIKCYRKYQKTKHRFYIIVGFILAVIFHELYNYHIGGWIVKAFVSSF